MQPRGGWGSEASEWVSAPLTGLTAVKQAVEGRGGWGSEAGEWVSDVVACPCRPLPPCGCDRRLMGSQVKVGFAGRADHAIDWLY